MGMFRDPSKEVSATSFLWRPESGTHFIQSPEFNRQLAEQLGLGTDVLYPDSIGGVSTGIKFDRVYDIQVESADGGTWGNRPESLEQGGSWIALPVKMSPEPGRTTPHEALPGYNETDWVNLDGGG